MTNSPWNFLFFYVLLSHGIEKVKAMNQSWNLKHSLLKKQRNQQQEKLQTERKMAARVDLDGKPIKPLTIRMIGVGGFIGFHLCENDSWAGEIGMIDKV